MHYYCLVILPIGEEPSKEAVSDMMEPFWEGKEVEPWEDDCWNCRGTGYLDDSKTEHCHECGGSGRVMSTSNPDGWWDWYVIGGRWNRVLDCIRPVGDGDVDNLEGNSCRVADIVLSPEKYPDTILTPDGEVHMSEDAGYRRLPNWADIARGILWRHAEHYAVVVDYHN